MSSCISVDMTFRGVDYGRMETPWSLNSLIYKGASALPINEASIAISNKSFGLPDLDRLPLAHKFFEHLQSNLVGGQSRHTVKGIYQRLRSFYSWADQYDCKITEATVEQVFLKWCDEILIETRTGKSKQNTVWARAVPVGALIDATLNRDGTLISYTSLRKSALKKPWGRDNDKINFSTLFAMGEALVDICNSLEVVAIQGTLPALLKFRSGVVKEHWSRLVPTDKLKPSAEGTGNNLPRRKAWIEDTSWRTRHPLMNLRIESELLIFIAQTQMNLAQASQLQNGRFKYQSYSGGYHVKAVYKDRSEGEVAFDVFSDYRQHFEEYLKWRNLLYPVDGLLFPLRSHFGRSLSQATNFGAVRKILDHLKIEYVPPTKLRLSKVNWLLRKTRDPSLIAEMAQHEELTLLRHYEQPNHQAALAEITRYHQLTDPAFAGPGPGVCITPVPLPTANSPRGAPKPDCANPAGCLFCQHQRDIEDLDHVWSLLSYRHLKSLELASHRPTGDTRDKHPAHSAIEILTKKISAFESLEKCKPWIVEANLRIEEGRYHLKWDGFIRLMEMRL